MSIRKRILRPEIPFSVCIILDNHLSSYYQRSQVRGDITHQQILQPITPGEDNHRPACN